MCGEERGMWKGRLTNCSCYHLKDDEAVIIWWLQDRKVYKTPILHIVMNKKVIFVFVVLMLLMVLPFLSADDSDAAPQIDKAYKSSNNNVVYIKSCGKLNKDNTTYKITKSTNNIIAEIKNAVCIDHKSARYPKIGDKMLKNKSPPRFFKESIVAR